MIDSVSVAEKIRYYTSDGHWSPEGLAEYLIGSLDCSTLREENEEWSRRYGALYENAKENSDHDLYKTGDPDAPDVVKDRNGEVVLGLCRTCGKAEIELSEPCVEAKS